MPHPFPPAIVESFLSVVQEACLPGVWSRGVALTRDSSVIQDRATGDELIVRVLLKGRPVHPRVTLWPSDEDWYCDCGDRNDPCAHVAAAVIALKGGLIQFPTEGPSSEPALSSNGLSYRFIRKEKGLELERWIRASGREARLTESLVGFIGGIQSGRIAHPPVAATQEDFSVDQLLGSRSSAALDRAGWARLLSLLESSADVRLDGKPIQTSGSAVSLKAELIDENGGFRLRRKPDPTITEVFSQGLVRREDRLHPVRDPELSASDRELLRGEGTFIPSREAAALVSEILPSLQGKIPLELSTSRLPSLRELAPRLVLEIEPEGPDAISVVADLVYGDPPIARVRLDRPQAPLDCLVSSEVPARDIAAEKQLVRDLQAELHLQPGNRVRIEGDRAVEFQQRVKKRFPDSRTRPVAAALRPRIVTSETELDLSFEGEDGVRIEAASVFKAWREGRSFVPLLSPGGGWAPLPKDWLERFGEKILRLLEARDHGKRLPAHFLPEALDLTDEASGDRARVSDSLRKLRESLGDFTRIPESTMPADLAVTPRSYQKQGIHWLAFLRDHEMGALLADDMGLGKTLQALCALRGKTLIICPTSVLSSWSEQIERFRPSLSKAVYHGGGRKLATQAEVVLTTYGILRIDRELLCSQEWDTIVLDEAHLIKNPDSQIARAAHSLRGRFKIALSGTPVENRLDDLWSQFQFINPGLLGSRERFQEDFASPIGRGDRAVEERLRARIRPFLLRRLKREVAPELPPRTEVTLHCELSSAERDLYESILAASRSDVLRQLEQGGSVFAALETLLRLRQTCCHPRLVPGQTADLEHSSKTSLLLETLEASIGMGHRSLVFSQWTSYLDLIEPLLERSGIAYLRLDGSTPNRSEVVSRFQDPEGPPVLLLSLKAGGVGLTLTAADHVFLLDPWWNPTVEDQAADRAHRIGQTQPVLIHRLVAKDTIEDRILQLQREKSRLSGAVLEGSASATQITREDLLQLLTD